MKTLDEVIKNLEDGTEHLSAMLISMETWTDALHCLQDYKKDREDPDGDHQQLEKARALLQEFFANPLLTWDELKTMEGKPVWVEERLMIDGKERHDNRWFLVGKVTDKFMDGTDLEAELRYKRCDYAFDFPEHDHWQAYRKER